MGEASGSTAAAGELGGEHRVSGGGGGKRGRWRWVVVSVALVGLGAVGVPWVREAFSTVSTDDAYVSGHATLVAARVPGQVMRVLVDDNNRVRKGDVLAQLDPEPYRVQVEIAEAAVVGAEADLVSAQAQARGVEGQMRSLRFALERSIEDVKNQEALLAARVASLRSQQSALERVQADYARAEPLAKAGSVSAEELAHRKEAVEEQATVVENALQQVYQVRVALGLSPKPTSGGDLTEVPPDLDQTFSSIREAQASLMQAAAQVGVSMSFKMTPREMVAEFYRRDPEGDIDRIYAAIVREAPMVKQAEAKLLSARRNLDQANLNLRYCDVISEIDGVVTRREINPGNNVVAGQSLMAVRSLTDIWVDANFKETQLAELRIGQPVDIDVDMYGSRREFKGRISGFSMGTGSTLALLPAENATGNFVKVVQRLPVRVDLVDYDPEKGPLFVGLSVTPKVRIHEGPTGPEAGQVLQPYVLPGATTQAAEGAGAGARP
jgi:membrane fusion protein (multidrug efflux system)